MRLRLLALAALLTVSGTAAGQEPPGSPPNAFAGFTLSCSVAAPSWVAGCFLEAPPAALGPLSFGVGLDGQVDVDEVLAGDLAGSHLAPYLVAVWSLERGAVWAELALPADALGVPLVGRADWARVGWSWTVPP